jgi:hypothetical protein
VSHFEENEEAMPVYRCPVCKKPLTKKEYESALGILEKHKAHLKHEQAKLDQEKAQFRQQQTALLAKARASKREGFDEGQRKEKARAERLFQGKDKQIEKLRDRIEQLQKGTTPQTEELEFEETLVARLQDEFPSDGIQHKGRGGDILYFVMLDSKRAGVIIYECKRTAKIPSAHIEQAFRAKQQREVDFAVLVTTGQRKKFTGLAQQAGVLIVSPLGVVPLVSLLRNHLLEMLKAKITKDKRAAIAQKLLDHVTSPQFRNPIEEIIEKAVTLQVILKDEAKQHFRMWETRWNHYQRISWDGSQIQESLQLVLRGKEPKPLTYPKPKPLQLLPPK